MTLPIISREEPENELDAILLLRGALQRATDYLDELLREGFPKKGKSRDEQDAWIGWHEDRAISVMRAKVALEVTKSWVDRDSCAIREAL